MNATELHLKDGRSAGIYFCSQCKLVHRTQELAEQCCAPYKCSTCGKDTGRRFWTICDACSAAKEEAKEAERFAKAEKLTAWDGWVFCEGRGCQNGFFPSLEDLMDDLADDGEGITYAWACQPKQFVHACLDDITGQIHDEAYEDFETEELDGLPELRAALDKFNEVNQDKVSYSPDHSKAIVLSFDPTNV